MLITFNARVYLNHQTSRLSLLWKPTRSHIPLLVIISFILSITTSGTDSWFNFKSLRGKRINISIDVFEMSDKVRN